MVAKSREDGADDFSYDTSDLVDHARSFAGLRAALRWVGADPRSPVAGDGAQRLRGLAGDAPLLPLPGLAADEVEQRRDDLRGVRDALGEAFEFAQENLGDEHGDTGW